jgi:transaldolase
MDLWRDRIREVIAENPTWSETQVAWQIYEELAVNGARLLLPLFEREQGRRGRLSIQTDPANYRNSEAILLQAEHFHGLAPNFNIKLPATRAGIAMVEEATYRGISVNVTVSFTVPQVLAAAEAIERGLRRREAEGKDIATMTPVATMMIGRLDDWLKVVAKNEAVSIDPECLEWPGVACFKKAYAIFTERGYRAHLLAAAYRNFYHWLEFVGGDVSLTMPYEWQLKFNSSDARPVERMSAPVDPAILSALYDGFEDFRRAYDEDGMNTEEFDDYGSTVRTLRSFIGGWHDFVAVIRDAMLPNPDAPS